MNMEIVTKPMVEDVRKTITHIYRNIYSLNKNDCDLLIRLMDFSLGKGELNEKEKNRWIETGVLNPKTNKIGVRQEFVWGGIVMPPYWLKCLLKYYGVI